MAGSVRERARNADVSLPARALGNTRERPLNILLYSHSFLPKLGGREMVVYQLARALTELGHKARIVGPKWTRQGYRGCDSVVVHRYPRVAGNIATAGTITQPIGEMQLLAPLLFDVARWGCDVIHAHSLYPGGYVARQIQRFAPHLPLILTPHGIDINVVADSNYGMRLDPRLRRKIDCTLESADAVTAISTGVHSSLLAANVAPTKIHRIGNGVDLQRFGGRADGRLRRQIGLPEDSRIILTVGNYSPLKGQADIIRAMPKIVEVEPKARLVIVGGGTDALRPLIESVGVREFVLLTGSISPPGLAVDAHAHDDLLADLYFNSSVYVSASNAEGAEGLSLALLDGIASGLPIVATDIIGNRDAVTSEQNGFLVPPGDIDRLGEAVSAILCNQTESFRMGRESRLRARSYSWSSVASQYVELYRLAMASKGSRRG